MRAIGTSGNVDNLSVGGFEFVNVPGMIAIGINNPSGGNYSALRLANGSSGYQVPGGMTLTVYAIEMQSNVNSFSFNLCYGTSDAGIGSGSPPSGVVYQFGQANTIPGTYMGEVSFTLYQQPVPLFQVPAGGFLTLNSSSADQVTVIAYGYLS